MNAFQGLLAGLIFAVFGSILLGWEIISGTAPFALLTLGCSALLIFLYFKKYSPENLESNPKEKR